MKNIFKFYSLLSILLVFSACDTDDLEPTLAKNKSVETSINTVGDLYGLLKGSIDYFQTVDYYGRGIIASDEVRSDNMHSNGNSGRYVTEAQFEYNDNAGYFWSEAYGAIATANIIINTDATALTGDQAEATTIIGQAKFLRALAHFDLLKKYGNMHSTSGGTMGIPYVTEFKGEDLYPARGTVSDNKAAIISDLQAAYNEIDDAEVVDTHLFPSRYAAKALESSVELYFASSAADWGRVKAAAEVVANSGNFDLLTAAEYGASWTTNGNAIFELAHSVVDPQDLAYIMITDAGAGLYGDCVAMKTLPALFENADGTTTDVRAALVDYEVVGDTWLRGLKYPDVRGSNNVPVIRYEEVILNWIEAKIEIGDTDALTALNEFQNSRNGALSTVANKTEILKERQKELMFEGKRWDDLMRTAANIDSYGSDELFIKTITYPNQYFAFPIPRAEVDANPNIKQNPGY